MHHVRKINPQKFTHIENQSQKVTLSSLKLL